MKQVTKDMIRIYNIKKLKYDFMGYTINRMDSLSFHHLIVPHRECKACGLGEGYLQWNGAILRQDTSHDYLHIIESIDRNIFLQITDCLIRENRLGYLSQEELRKIRILLLMFEKEHENDTNKNGKKVIKTKYITERIPIQL